MNCKSCRWYKPIYIQAQEPTDRGECHLYPPTINTIDGKNVSSYPTVYDNNCCAKFEDVNSVEVVEK